MDQPIVLGVIAALGGGGWIVTLVKAWLDHRDNTSAREQDADERLTDRLEHRLDRAETRLSSVEHALEDERTFSSILVAALARAGIPIPDRPTPHH